MKKSYSFRWRFTLRIIFPVAAAIILFVTAFYAVILPAYERSIMERKAEMIRELTNSAWSVLQKFHQDELDSLFTGPQARAEAASRIEYLRYGNEGKDYFWITDLIPVMVMHPYRKELNGRLLSDFKDPRGKCMFVEMADTARYSARGEGYVEYMWQWKDDSTQVVPKLSFVKLFKPWGWVVGTGIYLEDVRQEIRTLERGLLTIVLVITLILAVLLGIVAVQSFRIEHKRMRAEEETKRSEEKYRTLVEAASDGTLMLLDHEVVYANKIIQDLSGFSEQELVGKGPGLLFPGSGLNTLREALNAITDNTSRAGTLELPMVKKTGDRIEVELVLSLMPLGSDFVHVAQVKPLSDDRRRSRIQENLTTDLQTSVHFMSQRVDQFQPTFVHCSLKESIRHAALVMTDKGYDAILIRAEQGEVVGIVTDEDIRKRCLAGGISPDQPVYLIMSSPLATISGKGMLYEAISLMQERGISHLGVRNAEGEIISMVSNRELLQVHRYSVSLIRQQIEKAGSPQAAARIGKRIPELCAALLSTGSDAVTLVRFHATLFDSLFQRFVELALAQLGDPPVPFAFLLLGSAGREEQTLATDQDNAIMYADPEPDQDELVQNWFLRLGCLVTDWLHEAGYAYCPGKIMAGNPDWCQPLSRWKGNFSRWISSAEPQDLLDVNIFFDFRAGAGASGLCQELHRHIHEVISHHPAFFIYMAGNLQKQKPPLSLFGSIVVGSSKARPDAFDIKKALLPVIDMARIYALKEGIRETGTLNRLKRLAQLGIFNEEQLQVREEAYKLLMLMRFRHQVDQLAAGIPPDNYINPATISSVEEAMLKKVFGQLSEFTGKVVMDFKGGPG